MGLGRELGAQRADPGDRGLRRRRRVRAARRRAAPRFARRRDRRRRRSRTRTSSAQIRERPRARPVCTTASVARRRRACGAASARSAVVGVSASNALGFANTTSGRGHRLTLAVRYLAVLVVVVALDRAHLLLDAVVGVDPARRRDLRAASAERAQRLPGDPASPETRSSCRRSRRGAADARRRAACEAGPGRMPKTDDAGGVEPVEHLLRERAREHGALAAGRLSISRGACRASNDDTPTSSNARVTDPAEGGLARLDVGDHAAPRSRAWPAFARHSRTRCCSVPPESSCHRGGEGLQSSSGVAVAVGHRQHRGLGLARPRRPCRSCRRNRRRRGRRRPPTAPRGSCV